LAGVLKSNIRLSSLTSRLIFIIALSFLSVCSYYYSSTPSSNEAPARAASSTYIGNGNAFDIENTLVTCNSNYLTLHDSTYISDLSKLP
jgi:hypothetical protein